jgi:hypothetical protein
MMRAQLGSCGSACDTQGRLLETVVLVFDSGNELVIHAMKARPQLLWLLPQSPPAGLATLFAAR